MFNQTLLLFTTQRTVVLLFCFANVMFPSPLHNEGLEKKMVLVAVPEATSWIIHLSVGLKM